jgi:hypothetical protein
MNFKEWAQKTVSFDFDGVLHTNLIPGTRHPVSYEETDLTPNKTMLEKVKEEAKTNRVIVVSARPKWCVPVMEEFIKKQKLPIQDVFATDNSPKLPILKKMNAIRHYDDSPKVGAELEGSGIEFILVK